MGWLQPVGGAFIWHEQDPQWVTPRKRESVMARRKRELDEVKAALADTSYGSDEAEGLLERLQHLEAAIRRMERYRARRRPPLGERVKVVVVKSTE